MRLALTALVLTWPLALPKTHTESTFVIVPLRVHILTAPDLDVANCTLTDGELVRVIANVNAIWHQAGIHFGLESIIREPAEQQTRFQRTVANRGGIIRFGDLAMLIPQQSRVFDGMHAYCFRTLPNNGGFLGGDAVAVQQGARVLPVDGGGTDTVARVLAHSLGSALGLLDEPDQRNLMANGTAGIALRPEQATAVQEVARALRGAATVGEVRRAAIAAEADGRLEAARRLQMWLSEIPRMP